MAIAFITAFLIALPLQLHAANEEKPPLTISIAVDPFIKNRFPSQEELEEHLRDIVNRASLIFNADISRRLVLETVKIGLPPNAGTDINDTDAFAWLTEKLKQHPSRFWVFLIDRPLASCNIPGTWYGCALMNASQSIVVYNSDLLLTVLNLLHEIGHNCGADHSESENSIMYPLHRIHRSVTSYGDKKEIIRQTCG
jgi:hypothetical protein